MIETTNEIGWLWRALESAPGTIRGIRVFNLFAVIGKEIVDMTLRHNLQ
jgi:hypothetical protein